MREDEFAWEPYGAAMAFELEAALDDSGRIVSWRHEFWSNGHTHRPGRAKLPTLTAAAHLAKPFEISPAVNPALPAGGADRNCIPIYDFADLLVEQLRKGDAASQLVAALARRVRQRVCDRVLHGRVRGRCWRRPGRVSSSNGRRGAPRDRKGCRRFRAFRKTENRGRGIAFAKYKNLGAYCAVVAEVEATHELRVTRLVAAVDVGLPVNPTGWRTRSKAAASRRRAGR